MRIKTFENFNQKTDWSQVEFSQFVHFIGGISKELGTNLFKTDAGFFVRGWSESELNSLSKLEYKKNRDIVTINGESGLYHSEGGINVLWKIDNNYDRFEVKDNKMFVYGKDGSSEVLDFKEPQKLNESYEEIEKEEYLSFKYPVIVMDRRDMEEIKSYLPGFNCALNGRKDEMELAMISKNEEENYKIFIEKCQDDYFLVMIWKSVNDVNGSVSFEKNYYVCDQYIELKELLNDFTENKIK